MQHEPWALHSAQMHIAHVQSMFMHASHACLVRTPLQVTRLEQAMNRVVVGVLALLGTIALCLGSANMVWEVRHKPARDWYLGQQVRGVCVCVGGGHRAVEGHGISSTQTDGRTRRC